MSLCLDEYQTKSGDSYNCSLYEGHNGAHKAYINHNVAPGRPCMHRWANKKKRVNILTGEGRRKLPMPEASRVITHYFDPYIKHNRSNNSEDDYIKYTGMSDRQPYMGQKERVAAILGQEGPSLGWDPYED